MKLKAVILKNFRCYKDETRIDIDDLTTFIGKNDIGKSSILEAIEIFFNNDLVKIEKLDACVYGDSKEIRIGCVFTDFPEPLVLDVKAETSLKAEYLLNQDGNLEVHKCFECSGQKIKERTVAIASHPTVKGADDLLLLKNEDLKKRLDDFSISKEKVKLNKNPSIRKAIWEHFSDLQLDLREIVLDGEGDSKKIWIKLEEELPIFALFQSDRPSKDDDVAVQDPMKLAITEALKLVQGQLDDIKKTVQERATEVATRTLEKLSEMNPDLAKKLIPDFKAEPKWDSLFKLTLTDGDQIPINKRGSGVRRLILINFFRAEAERKQKDQNSSGIIYAIEEPETSQHPYNQLMLAEALRELSEQESCQVILTTHVPGFAGLLPVTSLRYVVTDGKGKISTKRGDDDIYEKITNDLGVLPSLNKNVQLLVCVEGPNDVCFLQNISAMLHQHDRSFPNIRDDSRIAIFHMGGSTLKDWVECHYLKKLKLPEIHIYDCDEPKYQECCNAVNNRGDNSWATLTGKRTMENYLQPALINREFNININFSDTEDVSLLVAKAVHEGSGSDKSWDELDEDKKKKKKNKAKRRLSDTVAALMTYDALAERDRSKDIEGWLKEISNRLR